MSIESVACDATVGVKVMTVDRVKRHCRAATECLDLADKTANPSDRALLISMATRWRDLAERTGKSKGPMRKPKYTKRSPLHSNIIFGPWRRTGFD